GQIVDFALDPLTWARFPHDNEARTARYLADGISEREALLDPVDDIRQTSIDPYVTIRSSYGLLRYSAIQNGRGAASALPNFEEIPPDIAQPPDAQPAPEGQQPGQSPAPQGQTPNPSPQPQPSSSPTASFLPGDFQ